MLLPGTVSISFLQSPGTLFGAAAKQFFLVGTKNGCSSERGPEIIVDIWRFLMKRSDVLRTGIIVDKTVQLRLWIN